MGRNLVIDWLYCFNSKESFFLIKEILGNFRISERFLNKISEKLKLGKMPSPDSIFCGMDFHLDWLYTSLELAKKGISPNSNVPAYPNENNIYANKQDIDFLIAYDMDSICHIILIEAKGVTGWTNKQMDSKMHRISNLKWNGIQPHFILISPNKPQKLNVSSYPNWAKTDNEINWIELPMPDSLKSVMRCDKEKNESENGDNWTVKDR